MAGNEIFQMIGPRTNQPSNLADSCGKQRETYETDPRPGQLASDMTLFVILNLCGLQLG